MIQPPRSTMRTIFPSFILAGILLLTVLACTTPTHRNIRAYYYPAYQLSEGKVYGYDMTTNGQTVSDYWYFTAFLRDSGVFLAATNYDMNFQISQIVREKITESGSVARDYFLYELDSTSGKVVSVSAKLIAPDLFPFEVKDSLGVFLFNIRYKPLSDTAATLYVIRNRRFLGDGPSFELDGKQYETVRFSTREVIGNEKEGSAEIEATGEEWYAKGLGLVFFKKSYGSKGQLQRTYKLKEIFQMSELEKRAGKSFGQ